MGVLSALGKFGLTEEKNGRIVLTKDAVLILMDGGNKEQREAAIKRCALKPQLYRELWDEYAESGSLPGDDTLKSLLVGEREFNPKSVDRAISAFRETISFADLSYSKAKDDGDNGGGQHGGREDAMGTAGTTLIPPGTQENEIPKSQLRDFAIPRKGQKLAILRLEFPVSSGDIAQIENWLKLMKDTLADE